MFVFVRPGRSVACGSVKVLYGTSLIGKTGPAHLRQNSGFRQRAKRLPGGCGRIPARCAPDFGATMSATVFDRIGKSRTAQERSKGQQQWGKPDRLIHRRGALQVVP